MNEVYVGLDLGSSSFQQAAINQDGLLLMNRSYPTSEAKLRSAFANLRGEIHVHLLTHQFSESELTVELTRRRESKHPPPHRAR